MELWGIRNWNVDLHAVLRSKFPSGECNKVWQCRHNHWESVSGMLAAKSPPFFSGYVSSQDLSRLLRMQSLTWYSHCIRSRQPPETRVSMKCWDGYSTLHLKRLQSCPQFLHSVVAEGNDCELSHKALPLRPLPGQCVTSQLIRIKFAHIQMEAVFVVVCLKNWYLLHPLSFSLPLFLPLLLSYKYFSGYWAAHSKSMEH